MVSFREFLRGLDEEGVAANCAGGGAIAGIGVGPQGEPGIRKKKKKEGRDGRAGREVVGSAGFRA